VHPFCDDEGFSSVTIVYRAKEMEKYDKKDYLPQLARFMKPESPKGDGYL
jgi:hypothetical protein